MTREEAIYCMEAYLSDDSHKHCIKCKYYKEDSCESSKAHTMAIKALEEQKTGKWVGIEYDGYADGNPVYDVWECSNCHEEHEGDFDSLPNYCPWCGAKMEVEE